MKSAPDISQLFPEISQETIDECEKNELENDDVIRISYATKDYARLKVLLRLCASERSERMLELSRLLLQINPSLYPVWALRLETLHMLLPKYKSKPTVQENHDSNVSIADTITASSEIGLLEREREFAVSLAEDNQKCYQIWHYLHALSLIHCDIEKELNFIYEMIQEDSKNYHAWGYLNALSERFVEHDYLADLEEIIAQDVRNNSAWNMRFNILKRKYFASCNSNSNEIASSMETSKGDSINARNEAAKEFPLNQEIDFVLRHMRLSPSNESVWVYLDGILELCRMKASDIPVIVQACQSYPTSAAAQMMYLDILKEQGNVEEYLKVCDHLKTIDPIRKLYFEYKKSLMAEKTH